MRILTFYFSGTGNTWWAVRELTDIFRELGHDAMFTTIEKGLDAEVLTQIEECDLVGFGYPVYGADFPPIFKRFLDKLTEVRAGKPLKKCFTICTVGYVNALGPLEAGRRLKKANFNLVGSRNIKLSNNASAPHFKTKVFNGSDLEIRKERARNRLRKFAQRIGENKTVITGVGPYLLPGYIIRKVAGSHIGQCHQILSIDHGRCSGCGLCASMCPTGSIIMDNEFFKFKNTCTACLRCYNTCPRHAILHTGKYADPETFARYKGPEKDWYRQMICKQSQTEI